MTTPASQLAEHGWTRLPAILSSARMSAWAPDEQLDAGLAGSRNLLDDATCRALVAPLRQALRRVDAITPDAVAIQCTLFRKTADCNWKVPYHQDLSVPVAERIDHPALSGWSTKEDGHYVQPPASLLERLLAVRLHLDPCRAGDGALRVLQGTHATGRIAQETIPELRRDVHEAQCFADAGDAILMRPLLLHASSKADIPSGRRVLHFLFAPPEPGFGLRWRTSV